MTKLIDLTGLRVGKLIVISRDGSEETARGKMPYWACRCDCGWTTRVAGNDLRRGHTLSCGCLRADVLHDRFRSARNG